MTAPPDDILLDVRHLTTTFPVRQRHVAAVDDVSFVVKRGETLGLVGESGSGKSVTALSLVQLVAPPGRVAGGQVLFEGHDLLRLDDRGMQQVRGRRIGFIFQEPMVALDPVYTIGAQIEETLRVHALAAGPAARRRALELLDAVRIPDPARRHAEYPHQLSGGLRQRAMIALALCADPALVIADEPTTALDVTVQAEILELLADMRRTFSLAMVLITHDLGVVARMAHRVAVMYLGQPDRRRPRGTGAARTRPSLHPGPARVDPGGGPGRTAPGHPRRRAAARRAPNRLSLRASLQRAFRALRRHARREACGCRPHGQVLPARELRSRRLIPQRHARMTTSPPLVQVRGLVKEFRSRRGLFGAMTTVRAVDDVTFTIEPGETFGLVGESGCGKTTTGRCLLRLVEPTAGDIRFKDLDVRALRPKELRAARRHFQIVFQDPYSSLDPRMRAGAIIEEPLVIHGIGTRTDRQARVAHLLELVGLDADAAAKYPHEFSGGQRQRIGVARALALEPSLVVADEPVSALDVSVQAQVVNLLLDLQARLGLTYLFIAHDLRLVREICTRVAVMFRGRIVELAPVDRIYDAPAHPYTQALLSAIPSLDPDAATTRVRFDAAGYAPSPLREIAPGHWVG